MFIVLVISSTSETNLTDLPIDNGCGAKFVVCSKHHKIRKNQYFFRIQKQIYFLIIQILLYKRTIRIHLSLQNYI